MIEVDTQRLPDGRMRVTAKGDVTSYTFQELQGAIDDLLTHGERKIVLDLSQVERLTSVGAGLLINAHGVCENDGGSFVLLPSASVRRVLDALGILDMFTTTDSADAQRSPTSPPATP